MIVSITVLLPRQQGLRPGFVALLVRMSMPPNLSLNPDASPAALTRRPLGAG